LKVNEGQDDEITREDSDDVTNTAVPELPSVLMFGLPTAGLLLRRFRFVL